MKISVKAKIAMAYGNEILKAIQTQTASKTAGMTVSRFLRTSAVNSQVVLYNTADIFGLRSEIKKIGNNINQIAMVVNSEKKVFKGDIDSLRREIAKISEEFHSYIYPLKSQEV